MLNKIFLNVFLYPLLIIWTSFSIAIGLPISLIARIFIPNATGKLTRLLIWLYGKGCLKIVSIFVPIELEISNPKTLKPPCIIVANHLSFFDVYLMALLPFSNVIFVVRNWPFKIWFYAPFMHLAQYLNTEKLGLDQTISQAQYYLNQNCALCFFPEAHRSRTGELGRFYTGAFKIARQTNVPIIPFCIQGTNIFLRPSSIWFERHPIKVKILSPVLPSQFSSYIEMRKQVKKIIQLTLQKIEKA